MKQDKNTLQDDIEAAERKLLVASWAAVAFSVGMLMYAVVMI